MVVLTRAPLRVSLGGGGTDLPSHYREHGGFVLSATIDRHVHVMVSTGFQSRFRLKHVEWEEVDSPAEVRHPILRAALERHWDGRPLELASVSEVPPGTGLGSSGAYTVAVLKALRPELEAVALAEAACEIEIDLLGRTVGKQDQYAAAHGGVCAYTFNPDDSVDVRRLTLPEEAERALRDEFLLFFTGAERSAADVLWHQVDRTRAGDAATAANLDRTKALAREAAAALESGDLHRCGELMDAHWEIKRARAPGAVTEEIEDLRAAAQRAGARGVMLMGAGGGGFLLVRAPEPERVRRAMEEAGATELRFGLEPGGAALTGSPAPPGPAGGRPPRAP
jgi:D-glycero-alpha-D-manno-heptose-7-phosphate kinase